MQSFYNLAICSITEVNTISSSVLAMVVYHGLTRRNGNYYVYYMQSFSHLEN